MLVEWVPDQRLLSGAPATLTATLADADGEPDQSIDSGVTVTVTRLDGTVLVNAQSASCTNGVATYALTAAQTGAGLDRLTVEWTHSSVVRATTYAEVVGRHWFPASELRRVQGVTAALGTGPGDTTSAALVAARLWAESLIEWATGVAWVPRVAKESLTVYNAYEVVLSHLFPRSVRGVTIDGVAQTVSDYALSRHGTLVETNGSLLSAINPNGFVVRYNHGADGPPPALQHACKTLAAHFITSRASTVSARLTGMSGEFGTISFARTDRDNPTGLPDVDAVIAQFSHRVPGMA